MNILLIDKYLVLSFIKKFLSVLFVFVIIFLVVDIIEDVDKMLDFRLEFNQYSLMYLYSIPQYINIAFPMTILIATVMTFTLLQKNNEITALKASGVSIYRLSVPFILIGILSSISMFYFENMVVTQSNIFKSDLEKKYYNQNYNKKINRNILMQVDQNKVIIIEKFDFRNKMAINVSLQEFIDNVMVSRIDAKQLEWNGDSWIAKDAIYRSLTKNSTYINLSDSILDINLNPIDLIESTIKPEEMDYWSLSSFIIRLKNNGRDYKKWLVDLHFKTAFPFSNILMVLFAIALTIKRPRSNFLVGIGSSILVIFIYYIMIKTGQTMGYNGVLPPFISVWMANIIFFIAGLFLLSKTKT